MNLKKNNSIVFFVIMAGVVIGCFVLIHLIVRYHFDYIDIVGMWRILQADKPSDYVLATGVTTSIRDFVNMTFKELDIKLEWSGEGVNEKAIDKATGKVVVAVNPKFFRPAEVDLLLGDSTKARTELGWKPQYDLQKLCSEMVENDLKLAKQEKLLKENGFESNIHYAE